MPKPVKPEEIPKKVEEESEESEEESEEESSDSESSSDSSDSSSDSSDSSSDEDSDSSEDEKEQKKKDNKKEAPKAVAQPATTNGKGKEDVKGKKKVEEDAQKGTKHKRSDEESSRDTQPDKKKVKTDANGTANGNAKAANGKANGHANGEANGKTNGHTNGTPSVATPSKMSEKEVNEWKNKHQLTVTKVSDGSNDPTAPFTNFSDANFPEYVQASVKSFGFSAPTPIQAQAWPLVMQGRDLVGIAETGSGKTLAFGYPAIMHIKNKTKAVPGPKVLVLAPTRELAQQIHEVIQKACEPAKLTSCCCFGGVDKKTQHEPVKKSDIVIATPGRLIDLLEDGSAKLQNVEYIVFDEADRMLDMGFQPQISRIMAGCPPKGKRQTLMFSATWPVDVQKFAHTYLRDPTQITIGSTNLAGAKKITQIVDVCTNQSEKKFKLKKLLKQLCAAEGRPRILVFMLYKHTCDSMYDELYRDNFNVDILHGGKAQHIRNKAVENFKNGTSHILIATDVAARGLDIKDIKYVINVEMPLVMEDYIHRIGRTGRAGEVGSAYTFFCPDDKQHARQLVRILEESQQKVPAELSKIAETAPVTKPRKSAMEQLYGDFAKGAGADFMNKKPTKITFD